MSQKDAKNLAAYQRYFTSGLYDRRYPSPNQTMWSRIEAAIGPTSRVLDFGCGSGRYLLRMRGSVRQAIGFDVSPAALGTIRARGEGWSELVVLGPDPEELDQFIESQGQVDVALCLFGVLGHITDPTARSDALLRLKRALKPGEGRLMISVPNRARRFRAEQTNASASGVVQYKRQTEEGEVLHLSYQLFDPEQLVSELAEAGFNLNRIGCESVLPESWLLHNAFFRWIDSLMTPVCPARWGYGIYAEASH